jgi:hypothetical protein
MRAGYGAAVGYCLLVPEKPLPEIEAILSRYPGLLWHHCPDSRGCEGAPGMPDLIIVGPGGVSWREAKPPGDHPRGGQVAWKYGLIVAGQDWAVWRPADVSSGLVRRQADALSRPSRPEAPRACECTCANCSGCLG